MTITILLLIIDTIYYYFIKQQSKQKDKLPYWQYKNDK